jgi:hypothetical protein
MVKTTLHTPPASERQSGRGMAALTDGCQRLGPRSEDRLITTRRSWCPLNAPVRVPESLGGMSNVSRPRW